MKAVKHLPKELEPFKFKKGVSGNPKGRPKGPTLKEWVRQRLMEMDEEERIEFAKRVPTDILWKMAEGNPHQDNSVNLQGTIKVEGVDVAVRK